jgi:hypothetical protein
MFLFLLDQDLDPLVRSVDPDPISLSKNSKNNLELSTVL